MIGILIQWARPPLITGSMSGGPAIGPVTITTLPAFCTSPGHVPAVGMVPS
ncbi:hypothetical protein ABZ468_07725 [Streptomyces sp. NPDC005708]|uniref:hypothetical protein n=1 Tax=Streptomyces sp. NPDC005708 TaxID=3154564 RepID=UPI003409E9BE